MYYRMINHNILDDFENYGGSVYHDKYIKYKLKYISAQLQIGGESEKTKYAVFGGDTHYPFGGWHDLMGIL